MGIAAIVFLVILLAFVIYEQLRKKEEEIVKKPPELMSKGLIGCSKEEWNVEEQGIPRFVKTDYIELEKIYRISKFRSSVGHDYSDSFESCRSMKHYFMPWENINWATVKIYSPVSGTVKKVDQELEGIQLHIEFDEYPAFRFKIFHINMAKQYKAGDKVAEGEQLGTQFSSNTYSDIAVSVREGAFKERLVSYFDVMTDNLFLNYMEKKPPELMSKGW